MDLYAIFQNMVSIVMALEIEFFSYNDFFIYKHVNATFLEDLCCITNRVEMTPRPI